MKQTKLMLGDNIASLKKLPENSIDAVVSDPPYGLSFMNKKWDHDVPSVEFWREVYRVLKPGGHILSFGGTRTYHRMVVNIEDAGFEIRDQIMWLYGSGFPKSHNISKSIDKKYGRLGYDLSEIKNKLRDLYKSSGKTFSKIDEECGFRASGYLRIEHRDDDGWGEALPTLERWSIISKVIGCSTDTFNEYKSYFQEAEREITGEGKAGFLEKNGSFEIDNEGYGSFNLTKSNTPEGSKYEGFGTALKPANEPICLARKPLSEKSIAENVIKWNTGGINIDGCRIGTEDKLQRLVHQEGCNRVLYNSEDRENGKKIEFVDAGEGRFPANLLLDEEAAELLGEPSRFFYIAKVGKAERNLGLDDFESVKSLSQIVVESGGRSAIGNTNPSCKLCKLSKFNRGNGICNCSNPEWNIPKNNPVKNNHPTVKPINLMTYLCRLITPEGGIVLDPFMGSGSTGIAARLEGFRFVGMELDEDYFKIAEARIDNYEEYRKFIKK